MRIQSTKKSSNNYTLEAPVDRSSTKKVLLKTFQNSEKNACVEVSIK